METIYAKHALADLSAYERGLQILAAYKRERAWGWYLVSEPNGIFTPGARFDPREIKMALRRAESRHAYDGWRFVDRGTSRERRGWRGQRLIEIVNGRIVEV